MRIRNVIVSLLAALCVLYCGAAFASKSSDALAKEENIAVPLAVAVFSGEKDFSRFQPFVDKDKIKDISIFGDAAKNIKDLSSVGSIIFVSFERTGSFDIVSYAGLLPDASSGYIFSIMFDPESNLVIGANIRKLVKQ